MNITPWVAAVGAFTGVVSLSWNIYLKLSAGPKLRVQAWAGMVKRPAPPGDPKFLSVSIQNIGTVPTTLTNYGLFQYASKRDRRKQKAEFAGILNLYEGTQAPHKLEIGDEAKILMQQDSDFAELLKKGTLYFVVWHSFGKRSVEVPIFVPTKE